MAKVSLSGQIEFVDALLKECKEAPEHAAVCEAIKTSLVRLHQQERQSRHLKRKAKKATLKSTGAVQA